jgi:cytochrome c biogenesis protein CcmG/thiol:disulfide interchange protein DsbE
MKKQIKKRNKFPKWIVWSVALIATVSIFYVMSSPSKPQQYSPSSNTNVAAPQFTLTDITGHPISLSNYRGKVVILDFWASWCPPCRREIPDFISLQKQYASQGLQIIGIGLDQPNNVVAFVQQYGINYPVAVGDDAISNLYGGVSGIPTTFIIDKEGNISNRFEGFTERIVFEQEIKKLL